MSGELGGHAASVGQALSDGAAQRLGSFRFLFADRRWEWSSQLQQMHGYEPGSVSPTTELVLSHKHPEDRDQFAAAIEDAVSTRTALSTRHRIIDASGRIHHVVVVSDQLLGDQGDVIGTHGFYVDVSPTADRAGDDLVGAKLAEIAEKRAAIEQAKGMLMLIYAIDDDAAFRLLKWLSQESNVKLRVLAEQLVRDFREVPQPITAHSAFDQLLLTAHSRVHREGDPDN